MSPDPHPTPARREELDWCELLAVLTELVGLDCTARVYASGGGAPVVTLSGRFERTFEPFELDHGPLFLLLGDGLLTIDPRDFERGSRELEWLPREECAVPVLEIALGGGCQLELDACHCR